MLMKYVTKIVHRIVISLKIEEFFIKLRYRANFFRKFIPIQLRHRFSSFGKFIPGSFEYPKDDGYFIIRDKTRYKINRSDYVQWRLFYGVRDNALRQAKKYLVSDSIVLDIGANCGGFSLRLATYAIGNRYSNIQIHAFEPNPVVLERYNNNLALNPTVNSIVYAHPIGLGNDAGERSFQYNDANTGVGRILPEGSKGQFRVKIQRLDDIVSALNPPQISFIKMIVEGFEPEVFKGGWHALKNFKPPIFFEVTPEWYQENNSSIEEIVDELSAIGYHQFVGEYHNELISYQASKFKSLYQFNLMASVF